MQYVSRPTFLVPGIARCIAAIYTLTLIHASVKTQLAVLGRYLVVEQTAKLSKQEREACEAATKAYFSLLGDPWQALSPSSSSSFVSRSLKRVCELVEKAVIEECSSVKLSALLSHAQLVQVCIFLFFPFFFLNESSSLIGLHVFCFPFVYFS